MIDSPTYLWQLDLKKLVHFRIEKGQRIEGKPSPGDTIMWEDDISYTIPASDLKVKTNWKFEDSPMIIDAPSQEIIINWQNYLRTNTFQANIIDNTILQQDTLITTSTSENLEVQTYLREIERMNNQNSDNDR